MRTIYVLTTWTTMALFFHWLNAVPINHPKFPSSQELNVSEDLRQAGKEWTRPWQIDQPSHMTPTRVHGGIMPD